GVLAAHAVEHGVVARLDRQVQVLAHRGALRDGGDEAIGEIPGMRRDEAETRDRPAVAFQAERVDGAQEGREVRTSGRVETPAELAATSQVGEAGFRRQVVAVRVDVLAEESDADGARARQGPTLPKHVVERPRALWSAAERDDAVGASLVAAVDDRDPGF